MPNTLFDCPTLGPADAPMKVSTPLGTLSFDADVDGVIIGDLKPSAAYHLEHGGYLLCWTLDGITAELLLCRPELPPSTVDDCWAGMWRVRVNVPADPLVFSCLWEPSCQWTEIGPESGEDLDAQTWEETNQDDSILRVTIGTADAECLAGHAQRDLLPRRWSELLGMSYGETIKIDPVVYLKDGFRIVLPALAAGEQCQVQFVVAWASLNKEEAENDVSTWLAVDCRPKNILSGAGCSRTESNLLSS